MTKVQLHFHLPRRIDDASLMEGIARVHGTYGIVRVILAPSLDRITVEYDASRLNAREVESVLHSAGLPIELPA